jgi:hypothetical protein
VIVSTCVKPLKESLALGLDDVKGCQRGTIAESTACSQRALGCGTVGGDDRLGTVPLGDLAGGGSVGLTAKVATAVSRQTRSTPTGRPRWWYWRSVMRRVEVENEDGWALLEPVHLAGQYSVNPSPGRLDDMLPQHIVRSRRL